MNKIVNIPTLVDIIEAPLKVESNRSKITIGNIEWRRKGTYKLDIQNDSDIPINTKIEYLTDDISSWQVTHENCVPANNKITIDIVFVANVQKPVSEIEIKVFNEFMNSYDGKVTLVAGIILPDPQLYLTNPSLINIGKCLYKSQLKSDFTITNKSTTTVPFVVNLKSDSLYYWTVNPMNGTCKPKEKINFKVKLEANKPLLDNNNTAIVYDEERNRIINCQFDIINKGNECVDCSQVIESSLILPPPSLIYNENKEINYGKLPHDEIIEKSIKINNISQDIISFKIDINSNEDIYSIQPSTGQISGNSELLLTLFINTGKGEIGKEYKTNIGILNLYNDNYDIIFNINSSIDKPQPNLIINESDDEIDNKNDYNYDDENDELYNEEGFDEFSDLENEIKRLEGSKDNEELLKRKKSILKRKQFLKHQNELVKHGGLIMNKKKKHKTEIIVDEETGEEITKEINDDDSEESNDEEYEKEILKLKNTVIFIDEKGRKVNLDEVKLDENNGYTDIEGKYHKVYEIPPDTIKVSINENGEYIDINGNILTEEDFVKNENNEIQYIYCNDNGDVVDISNIELDQNGGYIDEIGNYIKLKKIPQLKESKIKKSNKKKKDKKEEYLNIDFKRYLYYIYIYNRVAYGHTKIVIRTIQNRSNNIINFNYELQVDENTPNGYFTCEFENSEVQPHESTQMMIIFKALSGEEDIEFRGKILIFTRKDQNPDLVFNLKAKIGHPILDYDSMFEEIQNTNVIQNNKTTSSSTTDNKSVKNIKNPTTIKKDENGNIYITYDFGYCPLQCKMKWKLPLTNKGSGIIEGRAVLNTLKSDEVYLYIYILLD